MDDVLHPKVICTLMIILLISGSSKEETVQDSVKEIEGNRYSLKEFVYV